MNNYSSMKLELLALKWAITEKFRDLLIGSEFVVYTDNNPLSYVQTTGKLGATETRWLSDLAHFQFTIKYRSGRANQNADSLSRKTHHGDEPILAIFDQVVGYQTSQEVSTAIPASVREAMENTHGDVWRENVHTEMSRKVTLMATQAIINSTFNPQDNTWYAAAIRPCPGTSVASLGYTRTTNTGHNENRGKTGAEDTVVLAAVERERWSAVPDDRIESSTCGTTATSGLPAQGSAMCTARRHWASVSREDTGTGQNPLLLEWHCPRHHGVLPTVRTVHSGERGTEGA